MTVVLDDLREALADEAAVVVAGAGLAVGASGGAPVAAWRGLLENGIERCVEVTNVPEGWADVQRAQLALDDTESWLSVAEQVTIRLGKREGGEFRRWLSDTVGRLELDDSGRRLVQALVGLGAPICTTNYDGLIEQVAEGDPVTWRDGPLIQMVLRGDEQGVVHLHGFWRDPLSVVLGVRSYEEVLRDGPAQAMLKALATMRSLVLVGFGAGLGDPNFGAFRAWMAETWAGTGYRHFRLVRESERDAVLAEHGGAERIVPVVYGESHGDLEPFLRGLLRTDSSKGKRPDGRDEAPVTGGALPSARPFFGREELLEQIVASVIVEDPAPVPVLGPPGIGKSALTLACAHDSRVIQRFGAHRLWLRCDGHNTAAALVADLAVALHLSGGSPPIDAIVARLGETPTLLVLDNAETPWQDDLLATEELLGRLAAVPGLALVCSFRGAQRPLGAQWTDSLLVPPLPSTHAEQVFLAAAGDRFAADPALLELLGDLDGMPIAIELMARLAQPEQDLQGLRRRWQRQRTDLLRSGTDPDRHLSVAVSFDLSIGNPQLSDEASRLLSQLALHEDGVLLEDLDQIFENGEELAAELRRVGLAFDEAGRVRVLKPIREHVKAHYPQHPEDASRARAHYFGLAKRLGPAVGTEKGADAAARLTTEIANLTWAITSAFSTEPGADAIDAALALTDAGRFSGLPIEGVIHGALDHARELDIKGYEAETLFSIGLLEQTRSENDRARDRYDQALLLYREVRDVLGEANCIRRLGDIALNAFEYDTARERFEEALPLYRKVDARIGEANCIKGLGDIGLYRHDYDVALERYEEALPLYRRIGDLVGEANCIARRADIALQQRSDAETAQKAYEESLTLYREIGDALGEANSTQGLGDVARRRAEDDVARDHYEQALAGFESIGDAYSIGGVHLRLARVAASHEDRVRHTEAAQAAWLSVGRSDLVADFPVAQSPLADDQDALDAPAQATPTDGG